MSEFFDNGLLVCAAIGLALGVFMTASASRQGIRPVAGIIAFSSGVLGWYVRSLPESLGKAVLQFVWIIGLALSGWVHVQMWRRAVLRGVIEPRPQAPDRVETRATGLGVVSEQVRRRG